VNRNVSDANLRRSRGGAANQAVTSQAAAGTIRLGRSRHSPCPL